MDHYHGYAFVKGISLNAGPEFIGHRFGVGFFDKCKWRVASNATNSYDLPLRKEGRNEMFNLTTQSIHFIYGYMASNI